MINNDEDDDDDEWHVVFDLPPGIQVKNFLKMNLTYYLMRRCTKWRL